MVKIAAAMVALLGLVLTAVMVGIGVTTAGTSVAAAAVLSQEDKAAILADATSACATDGDAEVQAANAARAAGFPDDLIAPGEKDSHLVIAVAVAGQESGGWNPQAGNQLPDGRTHRGHMQISSLHLDDPRINVEGGDQRYDVAVNWRMAFRLWNRAGREWSPTWSGYTDGGYRKYLDRARAAVAGTKVNQCAVAALASAEAGRSKAGTAGNLNGRLDESQLCALRYHPGQSLRCDAAGKFDQMVVAYAQSTGQKLCVTDTYRDYAGQVAVRAARPTLAAVPGTSNHGWALAADLCGGIQNFGTAAHEWMKANAHLFGWVQPRWAQRGGSKPEPWHWEFGAIS